MPMTPDQFKAVVNQHAQRYRDSCSPSLAEMLLKVRGAVAMNYYDEQERDKDQNVGLKHINNQTIAGQTFRRLQDTASSKNFRERIDELLAADKPVGIYLSTPFGFHGFVIAGREQGHYLLLSKFSEEGNGEGRITFEARMPEDALNAFAGRDCIYLE